MNTLIVDTETTIKNTVADFGAVVVDENGKILEQFGVLLHGHFATLPLFSDHRAPADAFFSTQMLHRRRKHYDKMLENGSRSLCSPQLINLWLTRINAQYSPVLTAYNISFDFGKCANTDINLGMFAEKFCLMKAAKKAIGTLSDYADFCNDRGFLTPTGRLRMTADAMAKFIADKDVYSGSLADEPHTALEDARDYEAMILHYILKTHTYTQLMELGQ